MAIRFYINEVLTHVNIGMLDPTTWSYGDPLIGIGEAVFEVAIPSTLDSNSVLQRIIPNMFEVVITDGDLDRGGAILWAGWIDQRVPDPQHAKVSFHATHWKGWFYRREIPPATFPENFIEKDQYSIAYDLFDFAIASPGAPALFRGGALSGISRQLTVKPWWSVGEAVDDVAKRDGGFEWSIGFRLGGQTGRLELFLEVWAPGATRSSNLSLLLDNTRTTNRINVGVVGEDGTVAATRLYATSDGDEPIFAKDESPLLTSGTILLLERHTTYQDNRNAVTLFDYARAERLERDLPFTTIPVSLGIDAPAVSSYRVGDRARLRLRDAWRDLDRSGVRIVDKSVSKSVGQPALATVSLDMTDVRNIA